MAGAAALSLWQFIDCDCIRSIAALSPHDEEVRIIFAD
jgi:hypothetical protein